MCWKGSDSQARRIAKMRVLDAPTGHYFCFGFSAEFQCCRRCFTLPSLGQFDMVGIKTSCNEGNNIIRKGWKIGRLNIFNIIKEHCLHVYGTLYLVSGIWISREKGRK